MPQVPTRPILAVLRVCQRMLMQTGFLFRRGISVVADYAYSFCICDMNLLGVILGLSLYSHGTRRAGSNGTRRFTPSWVVPSASWRSLSGFQHLNWYYYYYKPILIGMTVYSVAMKESRIINSVLAALPLAPARVYTYCCIIDLC